MGYVTLRALSFQHSDAQKVPVAEAEIVPAGGKVPDYVKPYEVSALLAAGVIVNVREDSLPVDEFAELPPALPNPEVPPTLAGNQVLGSLESTGDDLASLDAESVDPGVAEAAAFGDAAVTEKPKQTDSKQAWEDYAVSQGVDRGEAESLTKRDLIAELERRGA